MRQIDALNIMKQGISSFLTGAPGSGKTYVLNQFIDWMDDHGIPYAVTASTGIAATHLGGTTLHSWSGLGINTHPTNTEIQEIASKQYIQKRMNSTEVLIIDEISMIEGTMLDALDAVLQQARSNNLPFGGIQIIVSGDFYQLPPISRNNDAPYAFQSSSWRNLSPAVCYLGEQHRSHDDGLLGVLQDIRRQSITETTKQVLSERMHSKYDHDITPTRIHTHNRNVDQVNTKELQRIDSQTTIYTMASTGAKRLVEKMGRSCLSPKKLALKPGALVMCTKNNWSKGYVNGTMGVVTEINDDTKLPTIKTKDGSLIEIEEDTWELHNNGKMVASITQLPLRLAWSITIHKSQGMSIDVAEIDLSSCFEYGQGYVALSRLTSLDGLRLLGINDHALLVDPLVKRTDELFKQSSQSVLEALLDKSDEEIKIAIKQSIKDRGGTLDKKQTQKKQASTYEVTKELLSDSDSIQDIATTRDLTASTIFNHIEELLKRGDITTSDIEHFKYNHTLHAPDFDRIQAVFMTEGKPTLSPIKNKLKNKYSFDELRFARLFIYEELL